MDHDRITTLLGRLREGDTAARDRLLDLLYPELRRIAAYYLRSERKGHTLQPTALVNEAYLRLLGGQPVEWQDRAHFIAVLARQMRRVLVDHARGIRADKRGGDAVKVALDEAQGVASVEHDVVAIDEALAELEREDSRASRVVELRFFGGLTEHEIAQVLGISVATVKRDWTFAKAWLLSYLEGSEGAPS